MFLIVTNNIFVRSAKNQIQLQWFWLLQNPVLK